MMSDLDKKLSFILVPETLTVCHKIPKDLVISMADDKSRKIPWLSLVGLAEGTAHMVSICDSVPVSR